VVPMTEALQKALAAIRHLRGERVFFQRDGSAADETTLRSWMERAERQAGLASLLVSRSSGLLDVPQQSTRFPGDPLQLWRPSGDLELSVVLGTYAATPVHVNVRPYE
jgi:hypothetical protein